MLVLTWEHIIALVTAAGALSGIVVAIISTYANRTKTAAEARHEDAQADEAQASGTAKLLSASSEFVTQLVGRVGDLEKNTAAQAETIQLLLRNDEEKKDKIEALEVTGQQQRDMIDGQQRIIERLREQVAELQEENAQLRQRIAELEAENRRLKREVEA